MLPIHITPRGWKIPISFWFDTTKGFYCSAHSKWRKQVKFELFDLSHFLRANLGLHSISTCNQVNIFSCILSKAALCQRSGVFLALLFPLHKHTKIQMSLSIQAKKHAHLNIDFECQQTVVILQHNREICSKKVSEQSANYPRIPCFLWPWNQMTFPVSLLCSLLRPMSVWHQTDQRWLVFGSDDVYSENGLDFSAAVSKRIICGFSK